MSTHPFAPRRGLYAIIDLDALAGRDPLAYCDGLLAAGALFAVQLRAKHATARDLLALARALAVRCRRASVPFVVNDRADVAVLADADGVHLGQDDLEPASARVLLAGRSVGVSTHTLAQAEAALASEPSYLALGPVFATRSKENPDRVVGLEMLAAVVRRAASVPVVAIGGVSLANAREVAMTGAAAAAVIAALAGASDLGATARDLHRALGGS